MRLTRQRGQGSWHHNHRCRLEPPGGTNEKGRDNNNDNNDDDDDNNNNNKNKNSSSSSEDTGNYIDIAIISGFVVTH